MKFDGNAATASGKVCRSLFHAHSDMITHSISQRNIEKRNFCTSLLLLSRQHVLSAISHNMIILVFNVLSVSLYVCVCVYLAVDILICRPIACHIG